MRNALEKSGLMIILLLAVTGVQAQVQNTWEGGTPGRPIDWNIASNWSLHRIPDVFDDVVIPNTSTTTFSYPVIDETVEVHSIRVESNAKLVILETGKLILNRVGTREDALANNGTIDNRGHNGIEFDASVYGESKGLALAKKN